MEIKEIELNIIKARENSRLIEGDVSGLAKSIEKNGLLQPIKVKELKDIENNGFKYEIVFGHRRYAAFKKLGKKTIPCIIEQNLNERGQLLKNIIENVQRSDVSAPETGRIYYKLIKDFGLTTNDISKELGIPISSIDLAIDCFSRVPKEYRDKIVFLKSGNRRDDNKIPATLARSIMNKDRELKLTVDDKSSLFDAAIEGKLTNEKMNLVSTFVKYGMDTNDAIKLSNEYGIIRVNVPIKLKELKNKMDKHKCLSKNDFFISILRGDIKETFNIPKKEI